MGSHPGTAVLTRDQAADVISQIFFDWQRAIADSGPTLSAYSAGVRRASALITDMTGSPVALARITPGQAQAVYDALCDQYAIATANNSRAALSHLYKHARSLGVRLDNPWEHVRERRQRDALAEKILTETQVARLIRAAPDGRRRLLLRWLYATGCRASEAIAVRARDLRRLGDGGWVVTIFGKGSKTRWVRLRPELVAEVARVRGRYLAPEARLLGYGTRGRVYQVVTEAAQDAGLPAGVSPHTLRHCHVSHALDHGVPLHIVRQEVGHSSVSTTERYTHVAPGAGSAGALPWL